MSPPALLFGLAAVLLLLAARGRRAHTVSLSAAGAGARADTGPPILRIGGAIPAPQALVAVARSRLRDEVIVRAGLRGRLDAAGLARAQAGLAVGVVGALCPLVVVAPAAAVILPAAALGAWLAPVRAVASVGRRRVGRLRNQLPDVLDVVAICTETGMSVDPALAAAAARLRGPLGDEIAATLDDIRLGATRRTAYGDLAARVGLPEMARLVAALLHADELGAPLSATLRAQASAMREARHRAARERAARAAPKIQLVVALLMVPAALLLVLAVMVVELANRVGPVFGGLS